MTPSLRLRINSPNVISENIDGEVIIINLETGHYYSLDKIGADIWSYIEENANPGEIVEALAHRYDGSRADIENAVNQMVDRCEQEGLVVLDGANGHEGVVSRETQARTGSDEARPRFEAPVLSKYTDMQDLLLLDPIHEVDDSGWPSRKPDLST